jgi:hypothetical protein
MKHTEFAADGAEPHFPRLSPFWDFVAETADARYAVSMYHSLATYPCIIQYILQKRLMQQQSFNIENDHQVRDTAL